MRGSRLIASEGKLRVAELYAGTGRAFEPFRKWRRAELALLVDVDRYAKKVYSANFRGAPYRARDLRRATSGELERWAGGRVDILLGCPPCQGFSDVGPKREDDPRNRHLLRFAHFIRDLKPLAVALENVPLAAGATAFQTFCERIEAAGYVWTAGILNAALYGSAQSRQRLVLVAFRRDLGIEPKLPTPSHGGERLYFSYQTKKFEPLTADRVSMLGETPATRRVRSLLPYSDEKLGGSQIPTVEEALEGLPAIGSKEAEKLNHFAWTHTPEMTRRMRRVPEGGRWSGASDHYSQAYGRLHRKGLARTITTFFSNPGSGRFWHPTEDRALSLREAARLQGFPDSFTFEGPHFWHACRLVGNALDAAIADVTYRTIREALE